jgi:UDP-N-acetylmuramyl pentapeptide phosphotransferase/UDP-N-acetylglucosamine-1-phosphate transferase
MNAALMVIGFGLGGALAEGLLLFFLLPMLKESGAVRKNYQGIDIPVSAGLTFPLAVMLVSLVYILPGPGQDIDQFFLLGLMTISLLGFIDDMLGQRDTLGFRGHFGALFHGRLTTGGLKALGGGFVAFFIAVSLGGAWWNVILNTFLMALFTNMMNLLDLRPGRAIKGYLFFLLLIAALALAEVDYLLLMPLLGAVLCYLPADVKARAMMGDAGSNVLGLALGMYAAAWLSLPVRIGFLLFLIAMHIYTEKYSLTATIENNKLLKAIDQFGRGETNGQ